MFGIFLALILGIPLALLTVKVFQVFRNRAVTQTELYSPMFQKAPPPLNYTMIPGWEGIDHTVPVKINSVGVRDNEWPVTPPEGLRILMLGDSATFGVSIPFEKTFPRLIQNALKKNEVSAHVYSAGAPGWNISDQLNFLTFHWDRIRPQRVFLLVVQNDLDSELTAGPSHQLMAPKTSFQPFLNMSDPWAVTAIAGAWQLDPNTPYSIQSGINRSHTIPYFENTFLNGQTETGKKQYQNYLGRLTELNDFLVQRDSSLEIIQHSVRPGSFLEEQLALFSQRLRLNYRTLSRWIGDALYYVNHWANVPIDIHGNENYHRLVAGLALDSIQRDFNKQSQKPFHESSCCQVPPMLKEATWNDFARATHKDDLKVNSGTNSTYSWRELSTIRQLLAAGGEGSQTRIVFRTRTPLQFLKIETLKPISNESVAVWIDLDGYRGFIDAAKESDNVFWGKLPFLTRKDQNFELGVLFGSNTGGILKEESPLLSVSFEETASIQLKWQKSDPKIDRNQILGWESDGWFLAKTTIPLMGVSHGRLKIEGEAINAYEGFFPLRVEVYGASAPLQNIAQLEINEPSLFQLEIPVKGNSRELVVKCTKSFVPSQIHRDNPDHRSLCFKVKAMVWSK